MAFKLFVFQKQFKIDNFLIKLTQFQKIGSIGQSFNPLGNLKTISTFETKTRSFSLRHILFRSWKERF